MSPKQELMLEMEVQVVLLKLEMDLREVIRMISPISPISPISVKLTVPMVVVKLQDEVQVGCPN